MNPIKNIPTVIVLACLALTACQPAPAPTAEPAVIEPPTAEVIQPETPTLIPAAAISTDPPLPTHTPLPPPAMVLIYQDDFSDPNSGWEQYREPVDGILDYEDSAYRMLVQPPQNTFWVNANQVYDNVILEVDAARREGPEENVYGLMCRLDSSYNAYMFVISSTGNYGIAIWEDHNFELLGSGVMESSIAIKTGTESNRIRATCVDSLLSLSVNGEEILAISDDRIQSGDVGLVTGTRGAPGVDILFDNFTIYQP